MKYCFENSIWNEKRHFLLYSYNGCFDEHTVINDRDISHTWIVEHEFTIIWLEIGIVGFHPI